MCKKNKEKPMSKKKKIVVGIVSTLLILTLLLGIIFCGFGIKNAVNNGKYTFTKYDKTQSGNYKIHFLNVTNSDAILIESNGKFGMIDCAEDSANPKGLPGLELKGHEEEVIKYVKKIAGDENGKVVLDFVLGTHAHSDHIGGFDTLIADNDIYVKRAYLKRYHPETMNREESEDWDNQEMYDDMISAIENETGCVLVQDNLDHMNLTEDIGWGEDDLQMTIYNGMEDANARNIGENENTMGVLVEKFGYRAFLSGDINNLKSSTDKVSDEERLAKEFKEDFGGKVHLLKAGHHGYLGSNSIGWINSLKPDIMIVPNNVTKLNFGAWLATTNLGAPIYGVIDHEGIVAEFIEGGFKLYDKSMVLG